MNDFKCAACGGPKNDPRYRACGTCREGWRQDKGLSHKEKTKRLISDLVAALKDCHPLIVNDAMRMRVGSLIIRAEAEAGLDKEG